MCNNFEPVLHFRDPEMLQEIYVTKNKYFDKHPYLKGIFFPLLGESTLFESSNQSWATKRKVLSTAFYKEKLNLIIVLIKEEVRKTMLLWKDKYVTPQKEMNIVSEVSELFARIILSCAFGEDISEKLIMIETDGVVTHERLASAFRNQLERTLFRQFGLQLVLLPYSYNYYLSSKDRETKRNCDRIR